MRRANAPSASALLATLAATVAGCGTREPAPTTGVGPGAPTSAAVGATASDAEPRAWRDPASLDAGWPGRRGSILTLVATSEGVLEIELRADHDGPATDDGMGSGGPASDGMGSGGMDDDGRGVGSAPDARVDAHIDSRLRFEPDAHASALLPGFRVLDRIEWSEGRATRHLTVEGWRPGVEVAVRIPHELLAREARLLVHGAPFTVEPGTHTFDLPLSRDETTILEWTPREPARAPR